MVVRLNAAEAPGWVCNHLAGRTGTRWIGVDGFGGAGKTTLAAAIAAELPGAVVVPVDHFARAGLPEWDRDLFTRQLLMPLQVGRPGCYQRWDLVADAGLDWVRVPPGVPVVVEGVSCTDVRVGVSWDLTLWLDVPAEVRWRRILDRDEPDLLPVWERDWLPQERAYAAAQRPWERVDVIVEGPPTND